MKILLHKKYWKTVFAYVSDHCTSSRTNLATLKDVAYSANENNGQNSFYTLIASNPSASEYWRKKVGTRTCLVAMLTWKSVIFSKINGNM